VFISKWKLKYEAFYIRARYSRARKVKMFTGFTQHKFININTNKLYDKKRKKQPGL